MKRHWSLLLALFALGGAVGSGAAVDKLQRRREAAVEKAQDRLLDCTPIPYRLYTEDGWGVATTQPRNLHIGRWTPREIALQVDGGHYLYVRDEKVWACQGLEWFDSGENARCVEVPLETLFEGR